MSNTDFVELLKKVRTKTQASSNIQQVLDYLDAMIDVMSMMPSCTSITDPKITTSITNPKITTITTVDQITDETPKSVECDPNVFVDVLNQRIEQKNTNANDGDVYVNTQHTPSPMYQHRFHGAEFTSDDL